MIRFKVTVYHRGIMVKVLAQNDKRLLTSYCESLISYEKRYVRGRGNVRVRKDTYATYHHRTCTYGIHRGYLDGIIEHLVQRGVSSSEIYISMQQQQPGASADIVLKDTVVARDYQVPVIEFSTDKNRRVVVLPIQTGRGKTMMTIAAMAKLKVRTVIGCGAQHIPTWMKEFNNLLDIDSERIR